jgi:hypothetical protein
MDNPARGDQTLAGLLGDMIHTLDHCASQMHRLSEKLGRIGEGKEQAVELEHMGRLNTRTASCRPSTCS